MRSDRLGPLAVGVITRPQGIRGEVRIQPMTDAPEDFLSFREVTLGQGREARLLRITASRVQSNMVCASLEGVETREAAEALRGAQLFAQRAQAPKLPARAYFIADLIGCEVVNADGHVYGRVREVLQPGANDVYVLDTAQGQMLIPAIRRVIVDVDVEAGRILVDTAAMLEVAVLED